LSLIKDLSEYDHPIILFSLTGLLLGFTYEYWLGQAKRKQMENVIVETENKYRQIVETSLEGIIVASPSGEILFANRKFADLLDYSIDEIIGRSANDFIPDFHIDKVEKTRQRLRAGESVQESMRFRKKDGTIIWTIYNATPLFDNEGRHTGNLALHTDITEKKKIEEELEAREKMYSLMISRLPNSIIYVLDKELKFLQTGGCHLEKTGFTPDMLKDKSLQDVFTPDIISIIKPSIEKAFKGEESDCETFFSNTSWLNLFVPVSDKKGTIDKVLMLSVDITNLKKVERELLIAQQKLEIAVDNANIGIWEWDFGKDLVTLDSRTEKMLSIEKGNYERSFSTIGNLIQEEDLPYVKRSLNQVIKTGNQNEAVFRVKLPNKVMKYLYSKAFLDKTIAGKGEKLTCTLSDVTSIKKGAEQVLLKVNQELTRMNTDLKQFVHFASHDLQEPLRSVSSFAQMLEMRFADKLGDDGREYIRFVVDGVNRMYSLINGIASYSRATATAEKFEKVRMNDVVEKATKNLNLKIREKNAVIESRKLPVVYADEIQMVQVFQNLIDNSLKFCKTTPHVIISVKSSEDAYTFIVKDNGPGISRENFEKAFRIFNRLGSEDQVSGRGIGLAICKRIVEGHGGKIWVESEPEKGASFLFTVPKYKFISMQ
jgi:PAS domain S-box-containing protein